MSALTGLLIVVIVSCVVPGYVAIYWTHDIPPIDLTPSNHSSMCEFKEEESSKVIYCPEKGQHLRLEYYEEFASATILKVRGYYSSVSISKRYVNFKTIDIGSRLTTLDGADLPDNFLVLQLRNNLLTSLNLSSLPATLRELDVLDNDLTELDLSTLPAALRFIFIRHNKITSLDLTPLVNRRPKLRLDMLNNPLNCTCELVNQFVDVVESKSLKCLQRRQPPADGCFHCANEAFKGYPFYPRFRGVLDITRADLHGERCLVHRGPLVDAK